MSAQKSKLEKLVEMALEHGLEQKPSDILGEEAEEFISLFARNDSRKAFHEGQKLEDKSLINAAVNQALEILNCPLEIYYHIEKNCPAGKEKQLSKLRQAMLETFPREIYTNILQKIYTNILQAKDRLEHLNFKGLHLVVPHLKELGLEDPEKTERDLNEAREYFAIKEPFAAYKYNDNRDYMPQCPNFSLDRELKELAKPNMVLSAIQNFSVFQLLAELLYWSNTQDNKLGFLTAEAGLEIIVKNEEEIKRAKEEAKEKLGKKDIGHNQFLEFLHYFNKRLYNYESHKDSIAYAAYLGARLTKSSEMLEKSREYLVKLNFSEAIIYSSKRGDDAELGGRIVDIILANDFHFVNDKYYLEKEKAYALCKQYLSGDKLNEARKKFVSIHSPEWVLDYGLHIKDEVLVKMAQEKLGSSKINETALRLFKNKIKTP